MTKLARGSQPQRTLSRAASRRAISCSRPQPTHTKPATDSPRDARLLRMPAPAPTDSRSGDKVTLPPVWLMALALVAVSANLRVAIASVPPLAKTIAAELDLSHAWIGAVTTLPVLCMGLMAPAAKRMGARLGAAVSVQIAMIAVFAGVLLRWWGDQVS